MYHHNTLHSPAHTIKEKSLFQLKREAKRVLDRPSVNKALHAIGLPPSANKSSTESEEDTDLENNVANHELDDNKHIDDYHHNPQHHHHHYNNTTELTTLINNEKSRALKSIIEEHRQFNASIQSKLIELNTNAVTGLVNNEWNYRLKLYGLNELPQDEPKSQWKMLYEQLTDYLVLMLIAACVISMITGQIAAAITIIVIIVANATLGVMQESKADQALKALESLAASTATVVRDSCQQVISANEVVPGDIIKLELGMKIPADICIIQSHDLQVNEQPLTGESEPVDKFELDDNIKQQTLHVPTPINNRMNSANKSQTQPLQNQIVVTNTNTESNSSDSESANLLTTKPTNTMPTSNNVTNNKSSHDLLTDPHMLYMGCTIMNGSGLGVVVKTGMQTKMGEVAHLLEEAEKGDTPLQIKLEDLGQKLGMASLGVSLLVFIIGVTTGRGADPTSDQPLWLQMLLVAVSLTVAAVPEGLPTCVTITLAIGMQNMVKKHALIRNLHSVETLGSCNIICTDKTGTLTTGIMTAVKCYFSGGTRWKLSGAGYDLQGILIPESFPDNDINNPNTVINNYSSGPHTLPILASLICSNASIQINNTNGQTEILGPPTEKPIIVAATKIKLSRADCNNNYTRKKEYPFNSVRKLMSVIVQCNNINSSKTFHCNSGTCIVVTKGAPDVLLKKCEYVLDYNNNVNGNDSNDPDTVIRKLTDKDRNEIQSVISTYSSEGLRVLSTAFRHCSINEYNNITNLTAENIENSLVFTGLLALIDRERDEVKSTIIKAANAGIKTVMITGDYIETAKAIAVRIGLIEDNKTNNNDNKVIDCSVIRELGTALNDAEQRLENLNSLSSTINPIDKAKLEAEIDNLRNKLDHITNNCYVYARAQPSDKITIVKSYQRLGNVCAMTGDGVNDAPALKQSNIGVSMGLTGTDVAKASSDMVLTDDNFVSIVAAVEEGRTIYNNISKFCFYLLSTNTAEVFVILLCVLAGMQSPLLPIQLLWLNLTTDGLPAIALALEQPEPGIMNIAPRKLSEPLMDRMMVIGIIIQTIALTSVCIFTYSLGLYWHIGSYIGAPIYGQTDNEIDLGVMHSRTMIMYLIVFGELARAYTCRTLRVSIFDVGIFSNKFMQLSVGLSVIATLIIGHVPWLMEIFSLVYMNKHEWSLVCCMSAIPVIIDELTKLVYRSTGFGKHKLINMHDTLNTGDISPSSTGRLSKED